MSKTLGWALLGMPLLLLGTADARADFTCRPECAQGFDRCMSMARDALTPAAGYLERAALLRARARAYGACRAKRADCYRFCARRDANQARYQAYQNKLRRVNGVWASTSGNVFVIPFSGTGRVFDIILRPKVGAPRVFKGSWVRGMVGTQFTYSASGATNRGTFSADDPNRIMVLEPNGRQNFWTRRQ